jgi:lipopolysaccharide export system protein LptA
VCAGLLAVAAPAGTAWAQAIALGHSNQPIEILADQNIEWQREQQCYIARGNASARQGDTTVYADVLTAFYRPQPKPAGQAPAAGNAAKPLPAAASAASGPSTPGPGSADEGGMGSTQIYRYVAEGHVRIVTPTDTATGDKGIYDIDTGVLVLTGHGLKLTTPNEVITARDSLEYWADKQMAVARGDAVVVTQDRRMTGDILTSYFVNNRDDPPPPTARNVKTGAATQTAKAQSGTQAGKPGSTGTAAAGNGQGNDRLQRVEGFGHVHVSTPTEIVTADRGVYNADTGIAMMSDNVRITRGDNQLNGDFAEVNLNTGISRLLTRHDGNATAQVRGLFIPQKAPTDGAKPADDKTSGDKKSRKSGDKKANP